jgi:hypothetical protein
VRRYVVLPLFALALCAASYVLTQVEGDLLNRVGVVVAVFGVLLGFGGMAAMSFVHFYAGPVQVHPLSLMLSGSMWIRFRNAAFAEMYLRSEFTPTPVVPLPEPPPPVRSEDTKADH